MYFQTFKSFKYPFFRLFFGAMLAHRVSVNMQTLVRSLLAYRISGSAAILGATAFAHLLPMFFLSFYGGAIADRFPKKNIIIIGELLSGLGALCVGLSIAYGYLNAEHSNSLWILIIASVLQGTVNGFSRPSQQAILPEIVGEKQLMNAVCLNSMSMNVMRTLAPALAGFLVYMIGFAAVYYTMAGMYFITAVLISFMPITRTASICNRSTLFDIKEGIQYIRNDATIFFVLVFTLFGVILSMPYMTLIPIFADDILKVGAKGLGILLSASGIGAIVSSLVLASMPNKKRGLMLLISSLILGIALAGFSFSNSWYLSLVMICLVGLTHAARMALSKTILYSFTEVDYRGRVMGIYMMEIGLISFGTFVAGLLTEVVGVQWALGSFSMVLILVSSMTLVFLTRIRNLD